jgi:hypothetical protein
MTATTTPGTYTGTSFDTAASGNGNPQGIAPYNDFFWITDQSDAEVYKYQTDGTYTGTSFDTAASGNALPMGIAHYTGFFWITDTGDAEVYKYEDGSPTSCGISKGTGTPILGYGWSDTIGWISLHCETGGPTTINPSVNICGTGPNQVNYGLAAAADGTVTGMAWSDNIGWVSANTCDLTGCPSGTCSATISPTAFSGWLRALAGGTAQSGGWDGFIALSDMNTGDGIIYGVSKNVSGQLSGFAWGDINVGWVDFSFAHYNSCVSTPSTVHSCDMPDGQAIYRRVVHTETDAICNTNVTYTVCTPPQFCSPGAPVCLTPPPTGNGGPGGGHLTAQPNLVPKNATTTVYWGINNVMACTVTATDGTSWTGAYSATSSCSTKNGTGCQSSPITHQTIYTLSCTALDASNYTETATVNLLPDFQEK